MYEYKSHGSSDFGLSPIRCGFAYEKNKKKKKSKKKLLKSL